MYFLSLQWHGSCGFHQCVGTTKDEAVLNEQLRDQVAASLQEHYKTIRIRGLRVMQLDRSRALDQIRSVLAEMKKRKTGTGKVRSSSC